MLGSVSQVAKSVFNVSASASVTQVITKTNIIVYTLVNANV